MAEHPSDSSTPHARLFRSEVMESVAHRLQGSVVIESPAYIRSIIAGVVVCSLFIGSIVVFTPLARTVSVAGSVAPANGLVRVTANTAGVVEAVHVSEGEAVSGRQAVVTFRSATDIGGRDSYTSISDLIERQRGAGTHRSDSRVAILDQEVRTLGERRGLLLASMGEARERQNLQAEQMTLAQEGLDRAEQIAARGFLPRTDLDARRNGLLSLRQGASELQDRILTNRRELLEIDARLAAIPLELAGIRAETDALDTQAALQEADLRQSAAFTVVAPINGRITALTVKPGQAVTAGAPLAFLVPTDDRMEAQLFAPSRSIGLIEEGQRVRLRYVAFPSQRFGVGRGVIRSISRSAITPADLGLSATERDEPMFRVIVSIEEQEIRVGDRRVALAPGTLLQADIEVERSSLFSRVVSVASLRREP